MHERIPENSSFRKGALQYSLGSAAPGPQGPLTSRDLGTSLLAAPVLLARSQQMALGLSQQLCGSLSRRNRLLHRSEAARRGAEPGAAAAVREAATAAEHRVGPRAVPRAGHRAPRPGGRPGTRAEAALARRGGDAGGPGGGAGEGEGEEEEREKGKEESRAGPPLPSPAPLEAETNRAAQPLPSASPTPKVRCRGPAARRPREEERVLHPPCVRPPELRAERAACSGGRRASSDLQLLGIFFFFFWFCGRAATLDPCCSGPLFPCKLRLPRGNIKGFREGRGAESQCGTQDLPAPSGQP